jgi:protein-disulfide isomerase
MATHGLDNSTIDTIATAKGASAAALSGSPATDKQLLDTAALFAALHLDATPVFIVGDEIIYGEDMDALNSAIAKAKSSKG